MQLNSLWSLFNHMTCPNRDPDSYEWICLCPEKGKTAKETIPKLWNSWVQTLILALQKKVDSLTEEQALDELKKLEDEANSRFQMWRGTC